MEELLLNDTAQTTRKGSTPHGQSFRYSEQGGGGAAALATFGSHRHRNTSTCLIAFITKCDLGEEEKKEKNG